MIYNYGKLMNESMNNKGSGIVEIDFIPFRL